MCLVSWLGTHTSGKNLDSWCLENGDGAAGDEDEDSCDDIAGSHYHVHGICDGGDHDVVPFRGNGIKHMAGPFLRGTEFTFFVEVHHFFLVRCFGIRRGTEITSTTTWTLAITFSFTCTIVFTSTCLHSQLYLLFNSHRHLLKSFTFPSTLTVEFIFTICIFIYLFSP